MKILLTLNPSSPSRQIRGAQLRQIPGLVGGLSATVAIAGVQLQSHAAIIGCFLSHLDGLERRQLLHTLLLSKNECRLMHQCSLVLLSSCGNGMSTLQLVPLASTHL